MALNPRDVPINRPMVVEWIAQWEQLQDTPNFEISLENYIRQQVHELPLPDGMVNTSEYENLENETKIADMIILDLPSYGPYGS